MLEFVAILIGVALLWQLRRTDFGKAMFALLGLCVLSLAIMTGAEIIKTTWKQPAPAFDPDEYLRMRLPPPVDPAPPSLQVEPTAEGQRLRQAQAERGKSVR